MESNGIGGGFTIQDPDRFDTQENLGISAYAIIDGVAQAETVARQAPRYDGDQVTVIAGDLRAFEEIVFTYDDDHRITIRFDARNEAEVGSTIDGDNIVVRLLPASDGSMSQILDALYKTDDGSHGAQVDATLGVAGRMAASNALSPLIGKIRLIKVATGKYGDLFLKWNLDADGALQGDQPGWDGWQYEVDDSRPATQALNLGDLILDETFVIKVTDASGLFHEARLVVAIEGTNDAAQVLGANISSPALIAVEAGNTGAPGRTAVSPIENGFAGGQIVNAHGHFVPTDPDEIDDTGNLGLKGWAATDGLQAGVAARSQATAQIFRNPINGGDKVTDVRAKWTALKALAGDAGATEGQYTAARTAFQTAINALPDSGMTQALRVAGTAFLAAVADKAAHAADANNVVGAFDTAITTYLNGADEATGDNLRLAGKFGVLTLEWDGGFVSSDGDGRWKWTYKLANQVDAGAGLTQAMVDALRVLDAYDENNAATHPDEVFNFIITDSQGVETSHSITIDVRGANDAPVMTGVGNGAVTEAGFTQAAIAGVTTATGTITFTDDDAGHDASAQTADGKGSFTYLFRSLQTEATGEQDPAAIVVQDNDGAQFTANPAAGSALAGVYGTLIVDPNTGRWTYTLNQGSQVVNALDAGDTAWDKFAVRVRDAEGGVSDTQYITITITGTNDRPVLGLLNDPERAVDTAGDTNFADVNGQFTSTDADATKTATYGVQGATADSALAGFTHKVEGTYSTLHFNPGPDGVNAGNYRIVYKQDVINALASGDFNDEYTVTVTDDQGAVSVSRTLTVNVRGVNDRPTLPTPMTRPSPIRLLTIILPRSPARALPAPIAMPVTI